MFKVGSGSLQYELVEGWEQIPAGYRHADVAGVCTDASGNVYLFCRGDHPVMVYDRDGKFVAFEVPALVYRVSNRPDSRIRVAAGAPFGYPWLGVL